MKRAESILVCGGGVIGLATAYYLARSGQRVTVVERGSEDHDSCALGSAGFVSPSHVVPLAAPGTFKLAMKWMLNRKSPFYVRPRPDPEFMRWGLLFRRAATRERVRRSAPVLRDLMLLSRDLYEEMAAELGNPFEYVRRGMVMLCKTPKALEHEAQAAALAGHLDIESRILGPAELAALEPALRLDVHGGVYYPGDAHLTPSKLMETLTRELKQLGVTFRWNTTVRGWRARNGEVWAAFTSSGDIEADAFVLCGGAWSRQMLDGMGVHMPLEAGKGYSLTLTEPPRLPSLSMICAEARVAVTPMGKTLRFGGTMELAGLDTRIRPERIQGIMESVPRYLPEFGPESFQGVRAWCGLRPLSPDGLPYIGAFRRYPNLVAATGHAMLGVTLAPVTGKLVAEILNGHQPSLDLEPLRPDRYAWF
ncbi:MAG TPA: FAD-dependent oxidoreductase [Candidatus Eisenbacteria bacterium]|nr:FAD-dependent oxidoreductase [Candidatus Eisenbacteria bacterium]